jgi:virginiamycin B lyase
MHSSPNLRALAAFVVASAAARAGLACTSLKPGSDVADATDAASDVTIDGPGEAAADSTEEVFSDAATVPDAPDGCLALDASPTFDEFSITSTSSAGPSGIVLGPDGNIWFALNLAYGSTTSNTGSAIGRMSPDGSSQASFNLPSSGCGPAEIIVGPDGNLWFTEFTAGQLGHIAPDGGAAVELPLPAGSQPNGIAVGPDGNIWFTDRGNNAVGWISVDGGPATEIPLPEGNSLPAGILAGADHNVWFTEQRGNRIAKIATTAGSSPVEYTIPTTDNPHGFTFGPDGDVWFTEFGNNNIGRLATDGAFEEFPNGTWSWRIITGPDGNLWFTESDDIGRITPTGTVSGWQVPSTNANVQDIAVGPTGTVWFTEWATDKIGRITVCE